MNKLNGEISTILEVYGNLKPFRGIQPGALNSNTEKLWALRYGLLQCAQASINIMIEIIAERNLGAPASYRECALVLENNQIISPELSDFLQRAIELRDNIIFEYNAPRIAEMLYILNKSRLFVEFAEKAASTCQ